MPFSIPGLLILRTLEVEWHDLGVCTGQALLNRLWARIVQYDVLGEQKGANLTEAGRAFQLGRYWCLHKSQMILSRQPIFFPRLFFQTSVWFALLCVKCPLFPSQAQVFP